MPLQRSSGELLEDAIATAAGRERALAVGILLAAIAIPFIAIRLAVATDSFAVLILAMLAPVVVMLAVLAVRVTRWLRLRWSGIPATASMTEIIALDTRSLLSPPYPRWLTDAYRVRYTYVDASGTQYSGESRPLWRAPREDAPHVVRYDRAHPERSVWIK